MVKRLPIGMDDFGDVIRDGCYYVDKTMLIRHVIERAGQVKLYTRPRRFGKTLNMSMLLHFLEIGQDSTLFANLEIARDKEFCQTHEGQYPVIFISLKSVEGEDYRSAVNALKAVIGTEALRFQFLRTSDQLSDADKNLYAQLIAVGEEDGLPFAMSDQALNGSLQLLTRLLAKHFGKKAVILIDEYDVPLDKAHLHGYYDPMVTLIRTIFLNAMKTNTSLAFAVLTGCLRISKESIFTGMNNLKVYSMTSGQGNEMFGFTDTEVDNLLSAYGLNKCKQEVREWYDGYRIGGTRVYCPWDVVNFCNDIYYGEENRPINYWANSSGNDLVRGFVAIASGSTVQEIELLIDGEHIHKEIEENVTYRDLDSSVDHLWSVLFSTGYLTGDVENDGKTYDLCIPNEEVRSLFVSQILKWFRDKVRRDTKSASDFYHAILNGQPKEMERILTNLLQRSISIRDIYTNKKIRENFYHGFILGLLTAYPEITSNAENGDGYSDITVRDGNQMVGAILELKYSNSGTVTAMQKESQKALGQIEKLHYEDHLKRTGVDTIHKYGISFHKKLSCVLMQDVKSDYT
ncbi:MAG: AAA family ATPase [Lachnospiraceae bacterium]|nr:AAA family ATPase [Lachnospiraceae bacterium]